MNHHRDKIIKEIFPERILASRNMNYQKFIILSSPRTGSEWLTSLFNSHGQMVAYSELFHHQFIPWIYGRDRPVLTELFQFREKYPIEFMRDIIFRGYPKKIKAVGFKIHDYKQPLKDALVVWAYLCNLADLKIIRLRRKNWLKQFVSFELAKKTGNWHVTAGSSPLSQPPGKIRLKHEDCLRFFHRLEVLDKFFTKITKDKPVYKVCYEDLCADTTSRLNEMQEFLGLKIKKLNSRHQKTNKYSVSEALINYRELQNKFKNTKWIKFFDD